jgi:hypothetical protein
MSIRTTVTLDEDVIDRLKQASQSRGASFRDTLNDLLRLALATADKPAQRTRFRVTPAAMGSVPGLNYDDVESLLDYGEGEARR